MMTILDDDFRVPKGSIVQLPAAEAVKWVEQQFRTSKALPILHDYFSKQGFTFLIERARVFVNLATDAKLNVVPSVLGILPSFVPTASTDKSHPAVSISIHDSGYALATSVEVGHKPFGVTEFTLYEIEAGTRTVRKSTLNADLVSRGSIKELAARMHSPGIPKAGTEVPPETAAAINKFTVLNKGDQALLIGTVVRQLLADKYSRALFPPEYATAINMQTPLFQKFAFVTSARFGDTMLGVTLSTSSSTSSNICTSTSTSTIEI